MIQKEIKGNLFDYIDNTDSDTTIIIPHCVNDLKLAGSGIIVPMFKRFPEAKTEYFKSNQVLKDTSYAYVGDNSRFEFLPRFLICNMCAQTGIKSKSTGPRDKVVEKPGRYAALVHCMEDVKFTMSLFSDLEECRILGIQPPKIEIHSPRFCSDRSGLDWKFVRELIEEIWCDYDTYIYYI